MTIEGYLLFGFAIGVLTHTPISGERQLTILLGFVGIDIYF